MSRINYSQVAPDAINKLADVTRYLESSSLDPLLRALVEIRISQINGCVYCVNLHTEQARRLGETQQRLDTLPVWHESRISTSANAPRWPGRRRSPIFPKRARPDGDYDMLFEYFSEKEIVDLSIAIALMNAWNRISVGFRKMPN